MGSPNGEHSVPSCTSSLPGQRAENEILDRSAHLKPDTTIYSHSFLNGGSFKRTITGGSYHSDEWVQERDFSLAELFATYAAKQTRFVCIIQVVFETYEEQKTSKAATNCRKMTRKRQKTISKIIKETNKPKHQGLHVSKINLYLQCLIVFHRKLNSSVISITNIYLNISTKKQV